MGELWFSNPLSFVGALGRVGYTLSFATHFLFDYVFVSVCLTRNRFALISYVSVTRRTTNVVFRCGSEFAKEKGYLHPGWRVSLIKFPIDCSLYRRCLQFYI